MDKHISLIRDFLYSHIDAGPGQTETITVIILAGIFITAIASYYISKGVLYLVGIAIEKSPTKWDDDLIDHRLMRALSQLAPALTVNWLLPAFLRSNEIGYVHTIQVLTSFYIIWAIVRAIVIFIGNLYGAMFKRPRTRPYAVKGIFQMFKLVVVALGGIVAISLLIGREPAAIITALGASAAVLMLVFKDTILGLVASIQLSANKMLRRGDWIVIDKHKADGEVIDVSLTTVKVRNWDNSVTTIPPYALVSDAFRNYQPMRNSGGRRVCRSIFIDVNSISFCSPDQLDSLRQNGMLEGMRNESAVRQVNLSLFRHYLENYLKHHKDVNHNMLYMVRQMAPTTSGLPIELYFFVNTTQWKPFEHLQSDIFDHVYAVVSEFGLRIFQTPSGTDVNSLRNNFALQTLTSKNVSGANCPPD